MFTRWARVPQPKTKYLGRLSSGGRREKAKGEEAGQDACQIFELGALQVGLDLERGPSPHFQVLPLYSTLEMIDGAHVAMELEAHMPPPSPPPSPPPTPDFSILRRRVKNPRSAEAGGSATPRADASPSMAHAWLLLFACNYWKVSMRPRLK